MNWPWIPAVRDGSTLLQMFNPFQPVLETQQLLPRILIHNTLSYLQCNSRL